MKYNNEIIEIINEMDEFIAGKIVGYTTGFTNIDNKVGRIKRKQIITVGGYNATGKSYFILNMLERMIKEKSDVKIAIFATEMDSKEYILRHATMRMEVYPLTIQQNPEKYREQLNEELLTLNQDFINKVDIIGDVESYEQVEKILTENDYDIAFLDFIQELSVGNEFDESRTMSIIPPKLKQLAKRTDTAIVIASQVNNSSVGSDSSVTKVLPFSYGKKLNNSSFTSILLEREKYKDKLDDYLIVKLVKARGGVLGKIVLKIKDGYKLETIEQKELNDYVETLKNRTI